MKKTLKVIKILGDQLRVKHWVKNGFVFAPLVFSGLFFDKLAIFKSINLFIIFCCLASGIYIFNDIIDLNQDKLHPKKKLRPLPAGLISINIAVSIAILLIITGISLAFKLNTKVFVIVVAYLINNLLYSFYLKNKVLTDVLSISIGFMLRFLGGAFVINVEPSRWLMMCGSSLSLFLAFGKRRAEIELLNNQIQGKDIRSTLEIYDKDKLNTALAVVNAICIMTYLLFVTDPETIARHKSDKLIYTVPLVVYGLFRYMYKSQEGKGTGPVEIILKDKAFIGTILLWFAIVVFILY